MSLFLTALGLVLVIEGFLYGGVPSFAKRMAALLQETPDETLRVAGLLAAVAGLGLVWLGRAF
ncbi:DUF2065 domain-containing protein [Oricola cellulosilytica]|uniref:DUF2065 domain-containing protein n=1 Tax=Oricola cellulosilytica TaxID=1429082 RepID=A0A4V2MNY4_9HYPH|nr:DUF2065 domain-containing protein [Oricola cellulosilytica]TCD15197.1 DUF2065 domain-containing protein [Oricola cellulosilytica]